MMVDRFTSASILAAPGNTSGLSGFTNAPRDIAFVTTSMCSSSDNLWQMPLTDPSSTKSNQKYYQFLP